MKNLNKKKLLIGVFLIIGLLSLVGISYALWSLNLKQTGVNELISDCFDVTFDELAGSNIKLENAFPLTDAEGEKLDAYHFTIKNKCQAFVKYQLQIEVTDSSTLDSKYVKVKLNQETPNLLQNYDPSDHLLLNNTESGYILETDYLEKGQTKEYDLRIWLDESVTTDSVNENGSKVQDSNWGGYITLDASYAEKIEKNVLLAGQTIPLVSEGEGLYEVKHDDYDGEGFNNTEYRYAGKDPNNYINFNGEQNTWRMIGLVNVKTATGITQRIKIIRDSIGEYSWDSSARDVNNGYGVNEWSESDIMKLLNPGYETNKDQIWNDGEEVQENQLVNNSLYWNGSSGTCYVSYDNAAYDCDFSGIGLSKSVDYISDDIVWNTGTNGENDYKKHDYGLPRHFYEYERSTNNGKICDFGNYCNDDVTRKTEWQTEGDKKALVGLMYPSDYGYATSGGTLGRNICFQKELYYWNIYSEDEYVDCINNDWLFTKSWQSTMSPCAFSDSPSNVFNVSVDGYVDGRGTDAYRATRPVVYLKPEVVITGGSGAYGDNYTIEIKEEKKTLIDTIKEVDTVSEGDGLYVVSHKDDETNLEEEWKATDELRYAGKDPKNYVKFNDENTWRIIGLVNVKTTSGKIEQRVKIIREQELEERMAWDTSDSDVNNGYGVNEWSQSDIMKLLNPGYDGESSNNSLYWNGSSGTCYISSNNSTESCDFTDQGLSKSVDYISDDIVWNTGSNGSNNYTGHDYGLPKHFYEYERSTNTGKICNSGNYCNDDVPRKTEWKSDGDKKALVGLMYPSDYGYATSGGTETNRTSCLDIEMFNWYDNEDCYNNDWLLPEDWQWTMSPCVYSSNANNVFLVPDYGSVSNNYAHNPGAVRPVVYLKHDVVVNNSNTADGSSELPYELALPE